MDPEVKVYKTIRYVEQIWSAHRNLQGKGGGVVKPPA